MIKKINIKDYISDDGAVKMGKLLIAIADTLNKLTKEECVPLSNKVGVDIKLCPIHDNIHYCKHKIGVGCKCECTCSDHLSTYKAKLKKAITSSNTKWILPQENESKDYLGPKYYLPLDYVLDLIEKE